jgi:nitroreductase
VIASYWFPGRKLRHVEPSPLVRCVTRGADASSGIDCAMTANTLRRGDYGGELTKETGVKNMPSALDLLTTRRSVKAVELSGPAPSAAEIDTLLTVASRVPDHGKLTPWRFIVFEGEARAVAGNAIAAAFQAKYPDAKPEHIEAERSRLIRAPLVVAVVSRAGPHVKIPEWEQVLSAGAAAMNLVLAAHALGYGANWITEWYAYDRAVLDALGLAPHERIAGFIHIGTPPGPPEDRPRPALDEIVTRFSAAG